MPSLRFLLPCLVAVTLASSPAAAWNPDPALGNPDTHRRLYEIGRKYLDENFDPDANLVGTPSHHPPNKKSHVVRESANYAYALLMTGDAEDRARAQPILRNVIAAQDTRAGSPSEGAFLWNAEDKWETLPNPDLNSAVFNGLTLVQVADLDRKHPCLDADVRAQVEAAAKLAIKEVLRRDVEASYSNIACISSALAAAGKKLWGMDDAGKWAEDKLDTVLQLAGGDDGAVYEYLSPTYGAVDLSGAYCAQKFAFSDAFSAKAKALTDHLWKEFAGSYHAPSYQIVGPNNRSYGEDMLTYAAGLKYYLYLALDGDYPMSDTDTDHAWDKGGLCAIASLPIGPRPEFKVKPAEFRVLTAVGLPHPPRRLSQYQQGNLCLGTVDFQDEWKQKRNLVAYWRSAAQTPEGFRIGYCLDESNETLPSAIPGAQIHFYSKQVNGAALVALTAASVVPGAGSNSLVFAPTAVLEPGDGAPFRVRDGDYTAYVYPVSPASPVYEGKGDDRNLHFKLERSWTSADVVGNLHVVGYVVVFRASGQPAPAVSALSLAAAADGVTASAVVDGTPLSLTFKN